MIPACFVSIALIWIGSLTCKQLILGIIPTTWICALICPVLAFVLSWETPSEALLTESTKKYQKDSPIISGSMKKQIITQVVWQTFVLFAVLFTGHRWIPESADSFDEIIGSDWSAKYSDPAKSLVANGLFNNPLVNSTSYTPSFTTYGVGSRHLTLVFNLYVLMQVFNCLNCRKVKDRLINILEGI